jgi:hypothetical protein
MSGVKMDRAAQNGGAVHEVGIYIGKNSCGPAG